MRRTICALLALGVTGLGLTACTSDDEAAARPRVGVILPDTTSSPRWEAVDRPALRAAFDAAGIGSDIQNAGGDAARFRSLADGMIGAGVKALLIANLDDESGGAVIAKATAAGIPVVDYDRLTVGGGARYHVAYDTEAVGEAMGSGLVRCLADRGVRRGGVVELHRAGDDPDALLLREGYDKVVRGSGFEVAAAEAVPGGDRARAGTRFERIDSRLRGRYVGVVAGDDALAAAVVDRLRRQGRAGRVQLAGPDVGDQALQRLLLGWQCVGVHRSGRREAQAAVALVDALVSGDRAGVARLANRSVTDPKTGRPVPAVLLDPQPVRRENVPEVVAEGTTKPERLCTTKALRAACAEVQIG